MGKPASVDSNAVPTSILKPAKTNPKQIRIASWNIRRGLLIREEELKSIIKTNNLGVIFLVETDSNSVNNETDYKLPGFKTIVQKKNKKPTSLGLSA